MMKKNCQYVPNATGQCGIKYVGGEGEKGGKYPVGFYPIVSSAQGNRDELIFFCLPIIERVFYAKDTCCR